MSGASESDDLRLTHEQARDAIGVATFPYTDRGNTAARVADAYIAQQAELERRARELWRKVQALCGYKWRGVDGSNAVGEALEAGDALAELLGADESEPAR